MYRIRFLLIAISCLIKKPKSLLEKFDLKFRAWPLTDTDVTRLFTQTYSSYMGLGRWHFVFSSEFKTAAFKHRWVPVTTAESVVYKRPIRVFEKVQLQTQLICWNERRFFLRQTFLVNAEPRAFALVEGLLRGPHGHVNPIEAFKVLGASNASPEMPDDIKLWSTVRP